MVIGICEITLRLPGIMSLKGKRSVLKSLIAQLRQKFNVSVAEVGEQDKWQVAVLAVACVSSDSTAAYRLLEKVREYVEEDGNVQVVHTSLQVI